MRALSAITLLAALILPTAAFAEIQTFTATHTYILGDHDSKDDARQRCLLEAKRKILEQAGVYIESASEVKNFDLTKDKITSFAAAVMQVKDTKEEVSFQQGHMTMALTLKADVDLAEVRKQLAARQVDASVRDTVAAQQERLKRLEAQLEAMQRQQDGKTFGHAPASPPIDISAKDLQTLHTQAAQGYARAQYMIGTRYTLGWGVPQDHATARQWYEKAAAQGYASAQVILGARMKADRACRKITRRRDSGTSKPPPRATRGRSLTSERCTTSDMASRRTIPRRGTGTSKPLPRVTRGRSSGSGCCTGLDMVFYGITRRRDSGMRKPPPRVSRMRSTNSG